MTLARLCEIAITEALIGSLWQGALLSVTAWLVLSLLAGRSAALRHNVGMVFLLACAAAPVATFVRILTAPELASDPMPSLAALAPPVWLAWIWAAGVAWKLLCLARGWRDFRRLEERASAPLPGEWQKRVERLRSRFQIGRPVEIRLVADVLPCSARLLRPIIWLPATLLTRIPPDQVEAILAHELAHIQRLDWLWNALQNAVEILFFYHPGLCWLSRRIRQERENACDDLAARACGDPIVLAEALGRLEGMRAPNFVLSSQGGLLMNRISRLLTPRGRLPRRSTLPVAALALAAIGATLALQSGSAAASDNKPSWWQLRGDDAVQLSGTIGDEARRYYRWRGRDGEVRELYLVDGLERPIDGAARGWIAETSEIAPPPPLPALPVLPAMTDDPVYGAAISKLRSDPAVRAAIGEPQAVRLDGPSRITGGSAELVLIAQGKKGSQRLRAVREDGSSAWRFDPLPAPKG